MKSDKVSKKKIDKIQRKDGDGGRGALPQTNKLATRLILVFPVLHSMAARISYFFAFLFIIMHYMIHPRAYTI